MKQAPKSTSGSGPAAKASPMKTASKLDPFASHTVANLKAKGPRVVSALLDVVTQRAESQNEGVPDQLSRLPQAWQATMLLAYVVERLEEGHPYPAILRDVAEVDDRTLLIGALKEIKEPDVARSFSDAEDVIDDEDSWSSYAPPEPEALMRLRRKIFALVGAMDEPFPAME